MAWVGDVMGAAYPEIVEERARIEDAVRGEEERFAETLDSGMRRIEDYLTAEGAGQGRPVDGRFLFTLYDTYGFPRDLAEDVLRERGWVVTDATERTWTEEMEAQRVRARAGGTFSLSAEPGVHGVAGDHVGLADTAALYQQLSGELPAVAVRGLRVAHVAGPDPGDGARDAARAGGGRGRRDRSDPRPHARLRRVGRPDGRHRHAGRPAGARRDPRHLLPWLQADRAPGGACGRAASTRTRTWR